jgi:hypothetical protein
MKRQLIAGLTVALLGVGCLIAEQQPSPYCQPVWQSRLQANGHFTLAGEYFYRRVLRTQPFDIHNVMFIVDGPEISSGHDSIGIHVPLVQDILHHSRQHANGNYGSAFLSYYYRGACEPYFALRGRWASGEVQQGGKWRDGVSVYNDILRYFEHETGEGEFVGPGFIPTRFDWSQNAHEWNAEVRMGYTFGWGCYSAFQVTPYLGAGYESGHMNFVNRIQYSWFYIPVGILASYQTLNGFGIALDADFGMMGGSRFINLDEPTINNIERQFGNRYRWELELPLTYTFNSCWMNGFTIGLVPFWHGWRVKELLQGEQPARYDIVFNGFEQIAATPPFVPPGELSPALPINPEESTFVTELETISAGVVTMDQPVASPRLLNNSWGGRLEFGWQF